MGARQPDALPSPTRLDFVRKVRLVHLDGSPPTIVDLGDARPTDMVWRPPTGAELLVRATTKGGGQDFFLVAADGNLIRSFGLPSPLRFGSDWENSGPAWSPDGTLLAYNRVEPLDGDPPGHFRIHVIRADGTGDRALPAPAEPGSPGGVAALVPGREVDRHPALRLHVGQRRPHGDLSADGSAGARDIGPGDVKLWTPDGSRVVSYVRATGETFLIDPATGTYEKAAWNAASEPDYRRLAP